MAGEFSNPIFVYLSLAVRKNVASEVLEFGALMKEKVANVYVSLFLIYKCALLIIGDT